jgi:hypothetical protein
LINTTIFGFDPSINSTVRSGPRSIDRKKFKILSRKESLKESLKTEHEEKHNKIRKVFIIKEDDK